MSDIIDDDTAPDDSKSGRLARLRSRLRDALRPARLRRAAARRPRTWVVSGLTLAIVALAVLGGLQAVSIRHHDQLDNRRADAVSSASDEVTALLTVSDKSSAADIKRLLAGATAEFRDELDKQAKAFQQALTQGKVTSTGSIAGAGLVSLVNSKAVVAVAAKSVVKNSSTPKGSTRNYRLTVTVTKVGGHWLTSALNFVV